MRPLHPLDFVFLSLEKKQQPMHVGGLFIFEKPIQDSFLKNLVNQIKTTQDLPQAPFNQQLKGVFWQEQNSFDLGYHFKHITLTPQQNLYDYISQEHANILNRKKPLWTCTLIDGFSKDEFALFVKVHHAMVDGIAAIRLMEKTFTSSHCFTPPWVTKGVKSQTKPTPFTTSFLQSSQTVYNEVKQALLHDRKHHPDYVTSFQAPPSIFNQKINASRHFSAKAFSLTQIKAISKKLNITLNDTILTLCSSALRRYLQERQQLPNTSLVAMVPASIRNENDHDLSNRITMILANLATNTPDAIERAHIISRSVSHAKTRFKRMTQNQILGYSAFVYAAAGLNIISGLAPKRQAFNIVISNVPGPKTPLSWNGAQLKYVFPASVIFDGQALNMTFTSYLDQLQIGLVACQDLLPNTQTILTYFAEEISHYEDILLLNSTTLV